jgi:shikimate kinase
VNIVLIGFMGSGKSEVGRRLAVRLGFRYLDTDALVEETAGASVTHIFSQHGEAEFRVLERQALAEALAGDEAVVAAGGGAVLDRKNVDLMRHRGVVFYLELTSGTAATRTQGNEDRPLLQVEDRELEIERLLRERRPLYEAAAHETVKVDELQIDEVVEEIAKLWQRYR